MKKILMLIVLVLMVLPLNINASDKVNVYAFVGNGCPHCAELEEYLDDIKGDYNLNVIYYEVWYNKANANILKDVQEYYNVTEANIGTVPFMIIGDKEFQGYASYMNDSIEEAINNYKSDDAQLLDYVKDAKTSSNETTPPNYIAFFVIIVLIVGLYFFVKPKKKVA